MIGKIFDTMIAAQLLGYASQSLAALVERHFGVVLAKSNQKADWSRRPLTPELLEYASGDTKHLERIYLQMKKELIKLGRFTWHEQSCARLLKNLNEAKGETVEDPLRWQLRGSKELSGRALARVRGQAPGPSELQSAQHRLSFIHGPLGG